MWHLYNLIREVKRLRTTLPAQDSEVDLGGQCTRPGNTVRFFFNDNPSRWRRSNPFPKAVCKAYPRQAPRNRTAFAQR